MGCALGIAIHIVLGQGVDYDRKFTRPGNVYASLAIILEVR